MYYVPCTKVLGQQYKDLSVPRPAQSAQFYFFSAKTGLKLLFSDRIETQKIIFIISPINHVADSAGLL